MKIYTKQGDKGKTYLLSGQQVSKSNIQIEAYGTIDELNSYLGIINSLKIMPELHEFINKIQPKLFQVGSILSANLAKDLPQYLKPITQEDIQYLELKIDEMQNKLPELRFFILPGGDEISAHLQMARCICRRAERILVNLIENIEDIVPEVFLLISYINRLSDTLFVWARYALFKANKPEIYWQN